MVTEIRSLQRRRRLKKVVALIASLLACSTAIYIVYFSSVFALQSISVQGSSIVEGDAIIQAAAIPLGTPLARINSDEVSKKLQVFPSVGSVEVRRVWPSEIVLAITERTPIATMSLNGRWKFVDESGVIYGDSAKIPDGLIPISAPNVAARRSVAEVIQSLPVTIKRQVLTVNANTEDSVELTLTGARYVVWGNSTLSARKVEVLEILLQKKAKIYDVSAPNFPTTRN